MNRQPRRAGWRMVLLLLGGIALLAGLNGALLLLGLPAPVITARPADVHGPLMVFGFVGTVVVLERASPAYDAVLHAVFLGFVMSMIMAHAPTILPAVLRRPLPYRPVLYAPALLLHASLVARILLGDARGLPALVQWGGAANIVAVLLFVVLAVGSVLLGVSTRNTTTKVIR